jgi:hypothetical protein
VCASHALQGRIQPMVTDLLAAYVQRGNFRILSMVQPSALIVPQTRGPMIQPRNALLIWVSTRPLNLSDRFSRTMAKYLPIP